MYQLIYSITRERERERRERVDEIAYTINNFLMCYDTPLALAPSPFHCLW
jgi:hypothetical protein